MPKKEPKSEHRCLKWIKQFKSLVFFNNSSNKTLFIELFTWIFHMESPSSGPLPKILFWVFHRKIPGSELLGMTPKIFPRKLPAILPIIFLCKGMFVDMIPDNFSGMVPLLFLSIGVILCMIPGHLPGMNLYACMYLWGPTQEPPMLAWPWPVRVR